MKKVNKRTYYFEISKEDLFREAVTKLMISNYNYIGEEILERHIKKAKDFDGYANYETFFVLGVESIGKTFSFESLAPTNPKEGSLSQFNKSLRVSSRSSIPFL